MFTIREEIIKAFRKAIFPYKNRFQVDEESDKESDKKSDEESTLENEESDEESAEQRRNQQGQCLKSLTPNQMLSRLLISLAQLKAGNNSEKLKNEIRQLLYSLYRSKKLTKQIYKSLIGII